MKSVNSDFPSIGIGENILIRILSLINKLLGSRTGQHIFAAYLGSKLHVFINRVLSVIAVRYERALGLTHSTSRMLYGRSYSERRNQSVIINYLTDMCEKYVEALRGDEDIS